MSTHARSCISNPVSLPSLLTIMGYSYLHVLLISSSTAVSATLNVNDTSRNRRFSVGTNPSKNILMPAKQMEHKILKI